MNAVARNVIMHVQEFAQILAAAMDLAQDADQANGLQSV